MELCSFQKFGHKDLDTFRTADRLRDGILIAATERPAEGNTTLQCRDTALGMETVKRG